MNFFNQLWDFFASIRLALFTLCAIAATSIIGSIIPQQKPHAFYVQEYGDAAARFMQVLDIPDMYSSWWFIGLLGLLSANLIICSVDRFPAAWKQITADQTAISSNKLECLPFRHTLTIPNSSPNPATDHVQQTLTDMGWKPIRTERGGNLLISAQKGSWTRTGVYFVHLSILIIFAGALVGKFFGFKGSIVIPETKKTNIVFDRATAEPRELGFTVQCDLFNLETYENGMPKEYRSRLTIIEDDQKLFTKDIEVNSPLTYRGITFYQSSYEGYRDFLITLNNPVQQQARTFIVPFQQQVEWPDTTLRFGIVNAEAIRDRVVRVKIWLRDGENPPAIFWADVNTESIATQGERNYRISAKQMYATGLQVAKDPGVWIVYIGCTLMIFGLYCAFFLTHRRLWVHITATGNGLQLLIAGTANKNKMAFERQFSQLTDQLSARLN